MPKTVLLLVLTILLLGAIPAAGEVIVRRVPDRGVQPQVAVDEKGTVHLIYLTGDPSHSDIFYTHSSDGGQSWSDPLRVNSQPGSAVAIGTVRGPQLALGRGGIVHVAWMGSTLAEPKVAGKFAPMLYARLAPGSASFEAQRNVIESHPGLDGGGAIAADEKGNVFVAWHAPSAPGAGEQSRQVWIARSIDDGKTFAPEKPISDASTGACGCCGMRLAAADGKVIALYRGAARQVNRGMHLAWADESLANPHTREIAPMVKGACVMSTSAIASSNQGALISWETMDQVFWSAFKDPDASPRAARAVPGAASSGQKHPAIAADSAGRVLIAWTEGTAWARGGTLHWALYDNAQSAAPSQTGQASNLPAWDAPAVVPFRSDFVILY